MGLFSSSRSRSTSSTDISTQTLGELGDVNTEEGAIAASLSNIADSSIGLNFDLIGFSGEDVRELLDVGFRGGQDIARPSQDLAGRLLTAFTAKESSGAAFTGIAERAIDTVKQLAIPLTLLAGIWLWVRASRR